MGGGGINFPSLSGRQGRGILPKHFLSFFLFHLFFFTLNGFSPLSPQATRWKSSFSTAHYRSCPGACLNLNLSLKGSLKGSLKVSLKLKGSLKVSLNLKGFLKRQSESKSSITKGLFIFYYQLSYKISLA